MLSKADALISGGAGARLASNSESQFDLPSKAGEKEEVGAFLL